MNLGKILLILSVFIFSTTLSFSKEKDGKNVAAIGFDFGISKKQALQIIKSQNKKIVEDTEDSKKIRIVLVEGLFIELPKDISYSDVKTKLEFYGNELMTSSLVFKSVDPSKQSELETGLSKFLSGLYGEPKDKEQMLNISSWTWRVPYMTVVLSLNPDDNITRVEYVYNPLNQNRKDEEYEEQQQGERPDPAKQMFIDGDYSKPTDQK